MHSPHLDRAAERPCLRSKVGVIGMVRDFDRLTIINAGTLGFDHEPCFAGVEFDGAGLALRVRFWSFDMFGGLAEAERHTRARSRATPRRVLCRV